MYGLFFKIFFDVSKTLLLQPIYSWAVYLKMSSTEHPTKYSTYLLRKCTCFFVSINLNYTVAVLPKTFIQQNQYLRPITISVYKIMSMYCLMNFFHLNECLQIQWSIITVLFQYYCHFIEGIFDPTVYINWRFEMC